MIGTLQEQIFYIFVVTGTADKSATDGTVSRPRNSLYMQLYSPTSDHLCVSHDQRPGHLACSMSTTSLRNSCTACHHGSPSAVRVSNPELRSGINKKLTYQIRSKLSDSRPLLRKDIFYSSNLRKMYESQHLTHSMARDHESCNKASCDETENEAFCADKNVNSLRLLLQCSVLRDATFLLFMLSSVLWTGM